jgi:two-component system, sensor histidine kinase ChiS
MHQGVPKAGRVIRTILGCLMFAIPAVFLIAGCSQNTKKQPIAVNGKLDLSQWNFEEDGSINLNGQWEFYWNKLLEPTDFENSNLFPEEASFKIPGRWNGHKINGQELDGEGYATFRLNVRIKPDRKIMAVRIVDQATAYTLWVNGEIVARNGIVATSRDSMSPQYLLQASAFKPENSTLEFILQVSNFNHRKGGVWNPILLGNEAQIRKRQDMQWSFDLLLFGSLIMIGLFHLVFYLVRSKDPSPLYFSICCFLLGLRCILTGSRFLTYLWPQLPWELLYKIELLTVTVTFPMMLAFIFSLYPSEGSKSILRVIAMMGAIFSLFDALMLARFSSWLVVPFEFVILFILVYVTYMLIKATARKREGAAVILIGHLIFVFTVLNDILNANDTIYTILLGPSGLIALVLSESFVLSKRLAGAFTAVETLSGKLKEKNIALSRMDNLKDEFLANTSHELRTPLNGIIGIAESLLSGVAGKPLQLMSHNLSLIVSSAKRLTILINDILDFARLKNKDIELNKKPVDMRATADTVLMVLGRLVGEKKVTLYNDIPPTTPKAHGDEDRLQQILYNLIGNAIKFTEQGEIRVTAEQQVTRLEICVSDTGIGIPVKELNRVFESFEQADSSGTRRFGGTGLGLAITKKLVELNGGEISVISRIGQGSTFRFTIPLSDKGALLEPGPTAELSRIVDLPAIDHAHGIPPPPTDQYSKVEPAVNGRARIVVVDDDPINLQVVSNYLSPQNMELILCGSGREALEQIENGPLPDLVLLDIMMPGMTGYDVCRELRKSYNLSKLPIIILTARNLVTDLVHSFATGANDYLVKPFSRDELITRIRFHLELKGTIQALYENLQLKMEVKKLQYMEEKALILAEKEALEKLRYQINPHFLFNALTSIRGAILNDTITARKMVTALSEFYRLSLSNRQRNRLSVRKEIELVQHYLTIEKIRMENYLSLSVSIDPDTENAIVPAYCLQPIVENAVKYGKMTSAEKLEIRITVSRHNDRLVLEVVNSGEWVAPESETKIKFLGIGIENIKNRLDKLYLRNWTFTRKVSEGWVTVGIELPFLTEERGQNVY